MTYNYIQMKKQIEKIRKETQKLQEMSASYERWGTGAFTTNNAKFAADKMQEIATACQGLEMVLI